VFLDKPYHITGIDADLYVEQVGPEDREAVYFLHGGPGYSSHSFRDLMGDDLDRYKMIYADQRGAGRSYAENDFRIDHLVSDVEVVLDSLEIHHAAILAHGFGAQVGTRVVAANPERFTQLILINPWLSMPLLSRTLQRHAAAISGHFEEALPAEEALTKVGAPDPIEATNQAFHWVNPKQLFDALEFPNPAARLRLEYSDSTALLGPQTQAELLDAWQLDVLENLGGISTPTFFLGGRKDQTTFPDQLEAGLKRMPNSLMSLIDGGHYPWLDDGETFAKLLIEILDIPKDNP
jgi:proline iminopeptidase